MSLRPTDHRDSLFFRELGRQRHGIIHLLGTGKQYKTGTYAQWLEFSPGLRGRPKAFVGVPDVSFLPPDLNARCVDSLFDVVPGEVAVIDDVQRLYPSRSTKDTSLQRYIGTISHKDILIILTGQCSQNYDIAFHRDQRVTLAHKFMDIHGIQAERPDVKLHCLMANKEIIGWSSRLGAWRGFFTYVPDYQEIVFIPEPAPWYDERLSHSLRDVVIRPGVTA